MGSCLRTCGIKHIRTPLYHPQSNSKVERFNKVLVECVQAAYRSNVCVLQAIQDLVWSYRTTPHVTTTISPFELMRGRKASTEMCPFWMVKTFHEGCNMKQVWELANRSNNVNEKRCEFKVCKEVNKIKIGDWVRVKNPVLVRKGLSKFQEPQQVCEIRKNAVRLSNGSWWSTSRVALDLRSQFKNVNRCEEKCQEGHASTKDVKKTPTCRRGTRVRFKPSKICDFVTSCALQF